MTESESLLLKITELGFCSLQLKAAYQIQDLWQLDSEREGTCEAQEGWAPQAPLSSQASWPLSPAPPVPGGVSYRGCLAVLRGKIYVFYLFWAPKEIFS